MTPQEIRKSILRMAYAGQSAHIGSALSCVEILLAIKAFGLAGDETILSKSHAAMALYAIWHVEGRLADADLDHYLSDGTGLLGHVSPYGALGHGLSVGVGAALGWTLKGWLSMESKHRTFVIVGDGELNEGACWEAIATAAQWRLENLYMIVDLNGYQGLGSTQTIQEQSNLASRLAAFGWAVEICDDGNNVEAIVTRLQHVGFFPCHQTAPRALICRTTKGYGVSFMAHNNDWHYNKLTPDLYEAAIKELDKVPAGDI